MATDICNRVRSFAGRIMSCAAETGPREPLASFTRAHARYSQMRQMRTLASFRKADIQSPMSA